MRASRKLLSLLGLCLAVTMPLGSVAHAENILRQILLKNGVTYDLITDADSGSAISTNSIGDGGASYELFARGTAWDTNLYFLDRKVVGFYLPQASVTVNTEDSFSYALTGLKTTRADKPFTLAISVTGLTTDPAAPRAAREVLYTRVGQNFNSSYVPGDNGLYTLNSLYMGNTSPNYTPVYTSLVPMDPTKAMGIERFTISSLTDETVKASSILAEGRLLVWPVTEARISGIESGQEIRDNLPSFALDYIDIYPVSMTYAQIYKGAPQLGTAGTLIDGTLRWHFTTVPQNEVITIERWEDYIDGDGTYTLEVLNRTPFGDWAVERLSYVSFNIRREVTIRGQVTTMEK